MTTIRSIRSILAIIFRFIADLWIYREVPKNFIHLARNGASFVEGDFIYYLALLFKEAEHLVKNGYHNLTHTLYVTWMCVLAAAYHVAKGEMTPRQARNLIIAALFHDWAHSGTKDFSDPDADKKEVRRAVDALIERIHESDRPYLDEIIAIMWASCFPYLNLGELSLSQKLIREIDGSQALQQTWLQQVLFGLAAEWGRTPRRLLDDQDPFLNNLTYTTKWGKRTFAHLVPQKIEDVCLLKEVLAIAG